jgi:hypothetical protein
LPLLSLTRFGNKRTSAHTLRHDANVIGILGVVGEYDGEIVRPDEAERKLQKAGISAVIYTSPRHTPEKPRWRVVCLASRELPPAEYEKLIGRVNAALGGILESCSFELSRSYYFGQADRVEDDETKITRPVKPIETYFTDGRFIDQCGEIEPIFPRRKKPDRDHDGEPKEPMGLTSQQIRNMLDGVQDWAGGKKVWKTNELGRRMWFQALAAVHHETGGSIEGRRIIDEWS